MPHDPLPEWVIARRRAIGDQMRAAREKTGITQEQLGQMIGRDRKTVNRIEQGNHTVKLENLLLVAEALDIPLADLVR